MTKKLFRFFTDNEVLIKWLESQKEFSSFTIDALDKIRTGELLPSQEVIDNKTLDVEYKKLRNEHLGIKIKIDRKKLSYMENFNSNPSTQAIHAIKEGVQQRELTEQEYENVSKYITLRKDQFNHTAWIAKCDLCKESETYETRKEAIDDMIRHLTTEHAKKVMEMRN